MGLDLVDSSLAKNSHDEIDILIGSDYYYDIIIGEIVRGEGGPVAVNSKLDGFSLGHQETLEKITMQHYRT
jgi:hypothetical protein